MLYPPACPARYASSGLFQTEDKWIHPTRRIDTYELILMVAGEAHLFEGDHRQTLAAGEALLLRPDQLHGGWQESSGPTSFYWIHFYLSPEAAAALPSNPFQLSDPTRLHVLCRQLLHIANAPGYPDYAIQSAFSLVYCEFLRLCKRQDAGTWLVSETAEWIRIHSQQPLTVAAVADRWGYHPDYLSALFRTAFGVNLKQYIVEERMKRIRNTLLTTATPIKTLAAQLGFATQEQFTHFFRYHEGISPARFRNLNYRTHLNKA